MLKLLIEPAGSWRCPCAIASRVGSSRRDRHGTGAMRKEMAGATGLEPATSAVTGQRSNQLSYAPAGVKRDLNAAPRQVKKPAEISGLPPGPDFRADFPAARIGSTCPNSGPSRSVAGGHAVASKAWLVKSAACSQTP